MYPNPGQAFYYYHSAPLSKEWGYTVVVQIPFLIEEHIEVHHNLPYEGH